VYGIESSFLVRTLTAGALIDIRGAFDAAWHPAITSAFGRRACPRYLIRFSSNFLHDREVVLSLDGHELRIIVTIGCPQGSLLSPFFWNVMIDDLLRLILPHGADVLAYADDITITATSKNPNMAVQRLQDVFDVIKTWLAEVKLKINALKTVLIIFNKRKMALPALSLAVADQLIEPSCSARILGVTIDNHQRWDEHVREKEVAFKRIPHSVRRYLGKTWGLSRNRIRTLYVAIAEPVFLYACSVWASSIRTKRGRKRIRSVERTYNVMMLRSFRSADAGSLSVLAETIPADYRIREMVLRRCLLGCFPTFSPSATNHPNCPIIIVYHWAVSSAARPSWQWWPPRHHDSSPTTTSGRCITEPTPSPLDQKIETIRQIRRVLGELWSAEWRYAEQGKVTQSFFHTPKCFRILMGVDIPQQLIQIFTGHSLLNVHQARIGFIPSPSCSCSAPIETIDHFLFHCPNFSLDRANFRTACVVGRWPDPLRLCTSTWTCSWSFSGSWWRPSESTIRKHD